MRAAPGQPPRRAQAAYEALRADLLAGRWPADTILSAYALAEELDMSRSPVGEALKRLHAEGLVESMPQVGVRVIGHSREDVADLTEILGALEGLAAQRAADHMDDGRLSALGEMLRRATIAAEHADAAGVQAADLAFRDTVLGGSSRHLDRLVASIRSKAGLADPVAHGLDDAVSGLVRVLAALRAGDGPGARAALERHVIELASLQAEPQVARDDLAS
ncbi:hypothetical protein DSM112329_04270 [Paraconexibacter sp. AEG42_29]|uniref:HTH gntR-type domain-containing protein n=1 Tax=Paraconexibacter sp. AEG42_29 TaxID=2997339 RepID=A0AAU7B0E8_9ACTN